ncbi:NAD(P)/FAD-dependent oxidoreductase [Arthrobacter sp. OY3WO11]|uniref:FAD-dependent oxidoreductase n=1 Tax=Arthrobacter sp. OY3WO11 TaxID=1835723 RepID=UPI0007CF7EC9|nr:NAD(P)/FAD-dependent oxidoreductase [Arthrobacter sp. OY3WO11]OAE01800.1 FAD-binding monooxygenase [Arthrobacter sp. OY3WO11]
MATDVVIVGGGPVGLYLAAALLQEGVSVRILEQRTERNIHTRAIGIHPPALDALDQVQLAAAMVQEGVPIRTGLAVSGGRTLGSMSFDGVSEAFPFVLALPQYRTEQLLEDRVLALDSEAIVRGVRVTGLHDDGARAAVVVEPSAGGEGQRDFPASFVVAADGARSHLRKVLGVPVCTKAYPDHYLMGDFADSGHHGQMAVLFLESEGIVESFPLPGGLRRWVVRLGKPAEAADAHRLARLVLQRTGILPDVETNTMLSAFSVRSTLARRTVAGRALLIGDAAHEISPIGGQGMNLGWMAVQALSPLIRRGVAGEPVEGALKEFEARQRRAAVIARRQSEINMILGRPLPSPFLQLRNLAIGAAASVPAINRWTARRFTMQQPRTLEGHAGQEPPRK